MGTVGVKHGARREPRLSRSALAPAQQAAAQIYAALREEILSLKLEPGSMVDRGELQARLGRSSTPIRDALMRLADEGLVHVVPQSATRISRIDVEKAREAQFLRRAVEIEAAKVLCEATDRSVVPLLRRLIGGQKAAAEKSDLAGFERLDREFHRRIYEAAGVADLHALIRQRSGHIDRIRRLHLPVRGKMQEVIRDHTHIAKAIAAGDAAEAQFRVRDHLSRSLAYTPALRELHPAFFEERV